MRQIKRENVQAVFIENMTSPRMAQMLARETGAKLGGTVYSDALSLSGGPAATYLDMLRHNTTLFAEAMRAGEAQLERTAALNSLRLDRRIRRATPFNEG